MTSGFIGTPKTNDEFGRQRALESMRILDTPKEPEFERITGLVKSVLGAPVAAVTLIDRNRQWFKSVQGLDVTETTRDVAFCDHTIRQNRCLKVEDATADPRFANNPLVTGEPGIRAYLGAPLITEDGYMLGALCVIDFVPRTFSEQHEEILRSFADIVMSELELRRTASIDDLTGLSNRRVFTDALNHAVEICRDDTKERVPSLILIDIDHFKSINDNFGHENGDTVLKAVAAAIKGSEVPNSVSCRIGGEEFSLVLTHEAETDAVTVARNIQNLLCDLKLKEIENSKVTASFGVASYEKFQPINEWRELADKALYHAKRNGRNRIVEASEIKKW